MSNPTGYHVINVCGTAQLRPCSRKGLNLSEIAAHPCFSNTVLTPAFAACHITVKDPEFDSRVVFLVFSSGVCNMVGAASPERLNYWFQWLFDKINENWAYAWQPDVPSWKVTMIAGVGRLKREFNPTIYKKYMKDEDKKYVQHEPERISALKRFYPHNPSKTTVQAFANSHKIVSTGSLNEAMGQSIAEQFDKEYEEAYLCYLRDEEKKRKREPQPIQCQKFFRQGWSRRVMREREFMQPLKKK